MSDKQLQEMTWKTYQEIVRISHLPYEEQEAKVLYLYRTAANNFNPARSGVQMISRIAKDGFPPTLQQEARHHYAEQAMFDLTGIDFGYGDPKHDWREPTRPYNRAVIARFAQWVKVHPAPKE